MEVKIIKANTPTELSSKRKIERLRVAAYCRVSTDDEDQTKSYQSMIKYYTDLIHNNKQWVFAGIFADKAITGTKADIREEFQRLIQECLSGKIDLVIAKSIPRFARNTLDTLKYVILIPMLINVFVIDCKKQIIPNRLTLTIFEIGLIFISMQVIINTNTGINTFLNSLLGMLIGGGIFLIINLVGKLFSQKEAMGFGDAKLMAVLGLFFGKNNIIIIFIIAALVSIAMLIKSKIKKQNMTEYIAFGPFIVLATAVIIYMPNDVFITMLSKILRIS